MTVEKYTFIVSKEDAGMRLDKYLTTKIPGPVSRSFLQKAMKQNNVLCNGRIASGHHKVHEGENINVELPEVEKWVLKPEDIPVGIIYEDDDIIVVDKPAGMVVHPACGHMEHTMANALMAHSKTLSGINGLFRPGIVHRLDKETSGAIIVAKTDQAHAVLADALKKRQIEKKYLALIYGVPVKKSGAINEPIARSSKDRKKMEVNKTRGREAMTYYKVMEDLGKFSLLEVMPKTGRTHQIRVHLNHIGHSIVGDKTYKLRAWGPLYEAGNALINRQALHASELTFQHPCSLKSLTLKAPLPDDMKTAIESLRDIK